MAAQKATNARRLLAEVKANETDLRQRQVELEAQLFAAPAETWGEAAEKARYLLSVLASTAIAQDPRRRKLIANVLQDFNRLSERGRSKHEAAFASPNSGPKGRLAMANREQRSNREKRRPKADKPKASSAKIAPFGRAQPGAGKGDTGKKGR